jgi:hypothetical protein
MLGAQSGSELCHTFSFAVDTPAALAVVGLACQPSVRMSHQFDYLSIMTPQFSANFDLRSVFRAYRLITYSRRKCRGIPERLVVLTAHDQPAATCFVEVGEQ